ncbi:unnamed protein product [Auanema sp. JU1783]|nr:unnamed protein product [Auanema sp. JU1783]
MIRIFYNSKGGLLPRRQIPSKYLNHVVYMSSKEVRNSFIKYFEHFDHINVPSSSVIPQDDPSLLFVNAGMNQFKSIFLGGTSNRWANIPRIVNSQKCMRAGGKHNDLEDVGKDFHHQTFFEMLGNWSFNNSYGKEAACELALNYLTYTLKIDPSRLYYTYFGGNKSCPEDFSTRAIWLKLGIPEQRILPFEKENFWEMGSVGPCGPCTEIHFDRVGGRDASALVNRDDSVVEIWNIVFMQLSRGLDNRLNPLPHLHIDTGMGLERLLSILQGVPSNFDTDLFLPLFQQLTKVSDKKYTHSLSSLSDRAYRLIADHLRAITVCLADGAAFGPDNRGFIMRKMLRRACWNASHHLNIQRGFTPSLVPIIVETLGGAYPELKRAEEQIKKMLEKEEDQFWMTIDKSKSVFNEMLFRMPENTAFSGQDAWKLHDTFGLHIDVTQDILDTMGLTVDTEEFRKLQNDAKMISRAASSLSPIVISSNEFLDHTDDAKYEYTYDGCNYTFPNIESPIMALYVKSNRVQELRGEGSLVLKECQFYGTEGGQKHDEGYLYYGKQKVFEVKNVRKVQGVTLLDGITCNDSQINVGMSIVQKIDEKRRLGLMRSHTGTHLINWALRMRGIGTGQRGSSVDDDSFRFDYGTTEKHSLTELKLVEQLVREQIQKKLSLITENICSNEIGTIRNLQSDIKEDKKYPPMLRVCAIGSRLDNNAIAVECCSGTHLKNTSSLHELVIMSDKSAAKGIRRLQVLTGEKARDAKKTSKRIMDEFATIENKNMKRFINEITWNRIGLFDTVLLKEMINTRKLKK